MHRSLSIHEVLLSVFSICDLETLKALARTCRTFHEPALDVLWEHQDDFLTLLKTMPSDLWEERQEHKREVLVRDTTPSRLSLYH
jgi:F-box-like